MSHDPRELFLVEDVERGGFCMSRRHQKGRCGHYHGELGNKVAASLDAAIDTDATAACRLGLPDGRIEEFRDTDALHHFRHFPASLLAKSARWHASTAGTFGTSELVSHPHSYGYQGVSFWEHDGKVIHNTTERRG